MAGRRVSDNPDQMRRRACPFAIRATIRVHNDMGRGTSTRGRTRSTNTGIRNRTTTIARFNVNNTRCVRLAADRRIVPLCAHTTHRRTRGNINQHRWRRRPSTRNAHTGSSNARTTEGRSIIMTIIVRATGRRCTRFNHDSIKTWSSWWQRVTRRTNTNDLRLAVRTRGRADTDDLGALRISGAAGADMDNGWLRLRLASLSLTTRRNRHWRRDHSRRLDDDRW